MRILITNDDGVYAPGIIALAHSLREAHEVTVVAPDRERSACSHSLTLDKPLSVKRISMADYEGTAAYAVNGTPADCVKVGVGALAEHPLDLVLSGVNLGGNLGTDVSYSGTVHAALEACICRVPAIALSQKVALPLDEAFLWRQLDRAAVLSVQLIAQLDLSVLRDYIYNINFPVAEDGRIKGVKVCEQGICSYDSVFQKQDDPFGREYFWLYAKENGSGYNALHQTDVYWSDQGYITITPMCWNKTSADAMHDTKCKISNLKLRF